MEKYDVSYRLEGSHQSLVSQLVPDVRPDDLPWTADEPIQPAESDGVSLVSLVCRMPEVPPGLIPWLIVRTHRYATQPARHWQAGTFLRYEQHGESLLELRGRALLFTVLGEWPQYFMTLLHDTVKTLIQESWPGLEPSFEVPCPRVQQNQRCSGLFPLEGLRKFKRAGDDSVRCLTCARKWSIEELLTGFRSHGELKEEVRALRRETRALASARANEHKALLRALASENNACPRTFTLLPEDAETWSLSGIGKVSQRLTLWCEHPDEPHPTCPIGTGSKDSLQGERGEYVFESSKEWLRKIGPLANRVAQALKILVPVGGAVLKATLEESLLKDVKPKLELMEKLTSTLLVEIGVPDKQEDAEDLITQAEGAGLREFHSLLVKLDSKRTWGHLRRVLTPTGDYLWLCPVHYPEFEPDLLELAGVADASV